jgi:alpha-methylacyl-CoA racemase
VFPLIDVPIAPGGGGWCQAAAGGPVAVVALAWKLEASALATRGRLNAIADAALLRNHKLIYGRLTGWGQTGPLSQTAGHDITYLAISGVLHGLGPKQGPPQPPVNYLADFAGGSLFLGLGLLAALLHAREAGTGQVLDASMMEGAAYLATMTRSMHSSGVWRDEREMNLDGGRPNYRCYQCSDDGWVALGALEPRFWRVLCSTLGVEPGQVPSPYEPGQFQAAERWLESVFKTKSRDSWAELFEPMDACLAPVLTLAEAPSHPHNQARMSYAEIDGARVPVPPPRFCATPSAVADRVAWNSSSSSVVARKERASNWMRPTSRSCRPHLQLLPSNRDRGLHSPGDPTQSAD